MSRPRFVYVHRDDMRRWQLATLAVQQQVQAALDMSGIDNWCGGGTLLGAVRDDGFLYWDNDFDSFFLYKDYRKALIALSKFGLFEKFDIYYNVNGYWERHVRLCEILSAEWLDESLLDFELETLSDTMFKVFDKQTVSVKLLKNASCDSGEFIQIKHFSAIHLTRERLAKGDDDIEDEGVYEVFPNVCMLPMLVMDFFSYLRSQYRYLFYRTLINVADSWKTREKRIFAKDNDYRQRGDKTAVYFEPAPYDPTRRKIRLALRNLYRANLRCIGSFLARLGGRGSRQFIVYKQGFFRFQVLPCPLEQVLPARKMAFEGVQINVPRDPDAVLTNQFGDYHRRPLLANRVAYPFFIKGRTS